MADRAKVARNIEPSHGQPKNIRRTSSASKISMHRLYYRQIKQYPILTYDQVKKLAVKYHNGDINAKNIIIKCNLRLVVSIASRLWWTGNNQMLSLGDLIQRGDFGLIRATEKYNPHYGYAFSTYATWWITQSIWRGINTYSHAVRVPVPRVRHFRRVRRIVKEMTSDLGRKPYLNEVNAEVDINRKRLLQVIDALYGGISLEAPVKDKENDSGSTNISNYVSSRHSLDAQNEIDHDFIISVIDHLLSRLSPETRLIILYHYGIGGRPKLTFKKISRFCHLSTQATSLRARKAIHRMRKMQYTRQIRKLLESN